MDGLDIYIGDYSKPDPLPEGLLDKLANVYRTLDDKDPAVETVPIEAEIAAAGPAAEQSADATATPTDPLADKGDTTHERRG